MENPTQDQLLNAAVMLDVEHPEVAAWLLTMAEQPRTTQEPNIPGLEADPSAFVSWAEKAGYDMTSHPMHFLFLDERTAAARAGWRAAREFYEVKPQAVGPSFHIKADALAQMAPPMLLLHGVTLYGYGAVDTVPFYTHPTPAQPQAAEPVPCAYGDNGRACCEGGPCAADVHNASLSARQAAEPGIDWSKEKPAVNDFAHWLNKRRGLPVAEVFHEIVQCYRLVIERSAQPTQPQAAEPVVAINVASIVRSCCEADKADPDNPRSICISVEDLTGILESQQQAVEPVTDEENERFSLDVSGFKGADPEATKFALGEFLKRRGMRPAPTQQPLTDGQTDLASKVVDQIMEQAQVFASAWSLVGGRFDAGDGMENADAEKAELRTMVVSLARQAAQGITGSAIPSAQLEAAQALIDSEAGKSWEWHDPLAADAKIWRREGGPT